MTLCAWFNIQISRANNPPSLIGGSSQACRIEKHSKNLIDTTEPHFRAKKVFDQAEHEAKLSVNLSSICVDSDRIFKMEDIQTNGVRAGQSQKARLKTRYESKSSFSGLVLIVVSKHGR